MIPQTSHKATGDNGPIMLDLQTEQSEGEVGTSPNSSSTMLVIKNETRQSVLADKATQARGFIGRGRGLMLASPLPEGGGLIIEPCNSIHMFFMRYALDVIFVDKSGVVLFMYKGIKPWRIGRMVRGARCAIELSEGTIARTGTEVGDVLRF